MGAHGKFACVALLLACLSGVAGASEGAGLFSAHKEAAAPHPPSRGLLLGEAAGGAGELELREGGLAPGGAASSAVLRSRVAEVDIGQLESARLGVEGHRQVRLGLNVFSDAAFDAVFERSAPTASGYTLTGRLEGDPLSTVALAVNGEWVAGQVWGTQGHYFIHPLGGGVAALRQIDPSAPVVRCGVGQDLAEGARDASPPAEGQLAAGRSPGAAASGTATASEAFPEDSGDVIDLLVVYRWFERRWEGGHRAMRALIDSDVAMTNALYRDSGAVQRINLVAAVELERRSEDRDLDAQSYLNALIDESSGYMDEAHALRDAYAADIVLGHWGHRNGEYFGIAGYVSGIAQLVANDPDYQSVAFSASSSRAFAHELGHNMGLRHERASDRENTPFPYSHGYAVPDDSPELPLGREGHGMQTIMHSTSHPFKGIPRFSNPNLRYPDESGPAIGVPGDAPSDSADGPADAARSLNQMRRLVANFRPSASRCRYELSPPPSPLPASGGEFLIRVKAGTDCAWRARSNEEFVSFADEATGVGDGEIAFRVSANLGWERDLMVFVAGEAYLAEQATAKTRRETSACDRAPPIRDALVEAAGKPCEKIGAEDLAAIRTLSPLGFPQGAKPDERRLAPGDFDGLTGLVSLDLGSMNLAGLAPDTFSGLLQLFSLDLSDNGFEELATGTFDGLPKLRELNLNFNRDMKTLAPGAFRDLSNMHELRVEGTGLTTLEPGAFRGLFELQVLRLVQNPLMALQAGAFDSVPNLRELEITGSESSTALEPGVFRGLSELRKLWLSFNHSWAALRAGVFDDLSKLDLLSIFGNLSLTTLEPGLFDGLSELDHLFLGVNRLTALEPGLFDGLSELDQLLLMGNKLTALEPGLFDGLSELDHLDLSHNQLKTLEPGLLRGRESLEKLLLKGNQLRALPPGLFEGLGLRTGHFRGELAVKVDLRDNPGAPFALVPELIRRPGAGSALGGTAQITAEVVQGTPFRMRIPLSAVGGALSAEEVLIPQGAVRGTMVSVVPQGNGPVTVLASAPGLPPPCSDWEFMSAYKWCLRGLKTSSGAPLILYGLPDQTLASNGAVRFDLPTAFPDFGEGASYAVESSDPAAVEVTIRGGLLIVSAAGGGETTLTLTATSPDGRRETRRFSVTAPAASPEAIERIPDLSLTAGESIRIELSDKFRDPNGDSLSYAVETSDPAVATALMEGGAVIVAGRAPGVATLTLTATDPGGLSATLSFEVKVEPVLRSRWGGWRSVLLQPPSSEDGGES